MNTNNKALFIYGFIFYFIGDLATTYIALINGMPESGLVRVITRYNFSIMIFIKVIFYTALYFLIEYLEKLDNYLCGAILGLVAGMGDDGYMDECSGYCGVPGMKIPQQLTGFSPDAGRNLIKKLHTH